MGKVKIYLDEDVRPILADILRERGYDTISTLESKMIGSTDKAQMDFAIQEERAILTHNIKDFVQMHRVYQDKHYGIILSEQISLKELLRRILRFLAQTKSNKVKGQIIWLSKYK